VSAERAARLVALWARLYTLGLPREVALRRRDELAADLHDQIAAERAAGVGERRIARGLASRALRGLPADLAWRGRHVAARTAYRLGLASALFSVLFTLWLMGAVGIVGVEGNPADQMYLAVLALGLLGATAARLRPAGMARVLFAMACAQALIATIALAAGRADSPISSVPEIVGLNALFATLFATSATLFRHAARAGAPPGQSA
jgi:hypothetical protein